MKKNSKKVLVIIFIILIIIVCILSVVLLTKKKNNSHNEYANLVIPLVKKNDSISFHVSANNMKKNQKMFYIFKVTNFRENKKINKDINYNIELVPSDNIDIKVYKNNDKHNILNSDNKIENQKLSKNKKNTNTYKIEITAKEDIKAYQIDVNISK